MASTTLDAAAIQAKANDTAIRNGVFSAFGRAEVTDFTTWFPVSKTGDDVKVTRAKDALFSGSPAAAVTITEANLRRFVESGADAAVSAQIAVVRTRRVTGRRAAILIIAALELA